MEHFREIEIEDFDTIVQKSLEFITSQTFFNNPKQDCFHYLDYDEFIKHCPEILTAFRMYNITPIRFSAFWMTKDSECLIHIDSPNYNARVNLPILNCDNSATAFYSAKILDPIVQTNGLTLYPCDQESAVEVERITIKKATVIKINSPHKVIMFTDGITRLTLSIQFDRDPVFLITPISIVYSPL